MKRDAVLKMRQENPGMKAAEIAQRLRVKKSYVYSVLYHQKRKQKIEAIRQAPQGEVHFIQSVDTQQVNSLKREIEELTIIIAYLEHRVKVAEAKHGSAI
jgi:predicted transcriptional regulator